MNRLYSPGILLSFLLILFASTIARAHCDTIDGAVAKSVQAALEAKDVTPALRWVSADQEAEVRQAFDKTLAVRATNDQAKELADHYFLETVVRLHRRTEGAPYAGLKEGGEEEPAIQAADEALGKGDPEEMIQMIVSAVEKSLRESYKEAAEAKGHADESVEAGRHYVRAYVTFIHLAENIYNAAAKPPVHEHQQPAHEPEAETEASPAAHGH